MDRRPVSRDSLPDGSGDQHERPRRKPFFLRIPCVTAVSMARLDGGPLDDRRGLRALWDRAFGVPGPHQEGRATTPRGARADLAGGLLGEAHSPTSEAVRRARPGVCSWASRTARPVASKRSRGWKRLFCGVLRRPKAALAHGVARRSRAPRGIVAGRARRALSTRRPGGGFCRDHPRRGLGPVLRAPRPMTSRKVMVCFRPCTGLFGGEPRALPCWASLWSGSATAQCM